MKNYKFTHTGTLKKDDYGALIKTPGVRLRETKNFWVSTSGYKYRKTNGSRVGNKWYWLDLDTIQAISEHAPEPAIVPGCADVGL